MLLNLLFWSFLIASLPFALDLAIQLTVAIVQGLVSILRAPSARPVNADRLASQSWSRLSSR
jgi:hypothetical protein